MTGVRIGEEGRKNAGAYGRNSRVSDRNGTTLRRLVGDSWRTLMNTFVSPLEGGKSRTFNGMILQIIPKKRIGYILAGKLTTFLLEMPPSSFNRLRAASWSIRTKQSSVNPTGLGFKVVGRWPVRSDTDRYEHLTQPIT